MAPWLISTSVMADRVLLRNVQFYFYLIYLPLLIPLFLCRSSSLDLYYPKTEFLLLLSLFLSRLSKVYVS